MDASYGGLGSFHKGRPSVTRPPRSHESMQPREGGGPTTGTGVTSSQRAVLDPIPNALGGGERGFKGDGQFLFSGLPSFIDIEVSQRLGPEPRGSVACVGDEVAGARTSDSTWAPLDFKGSKCKVLTSKGCARRCT